MNFKLDKEKPTLEIQVNIGRHIAVRATEFFLKNFFRNLNLETPLDGNKHTLTEGISFICTEAPSPDQDQSTLTSNPWIPKYSSLSIRFEGDYKKLSKLKKELLRKYCSYCSEHPMQ